MRASRLEDLTGTTWAGQAQLWLHEDELAVHFDATVRIAKGTIHYEWKDRRRPHHGEIVWRRSGQTQDLLEAGWMDNRCTGPGITLAANGTAGAAPLLALTAPFANPEHGKWRVVVAQRPEGDAIVLQIWNGAPWGEEHLELQLVAKPV
jgi:hypothetical protein